MPGIDANLRVWSTARYDRSGCLAQALQEYQIIGKDGRLIERRELPLQFAIIDRSTFEAEATAAGFKVLHLWGDYARSPFEPERSPFMIWKLTCKHPDRCPRMKPMNGILN
jgi:hypothetical protein